MTNNNIHNKQNILTNHINANVKIKLSMYEGKLDGNIFDRQEVVIPEEVCTQNSLDFTCKENSAYIGVI